MAKRAHHGFGMRIVVQNRSKVAPEVLAKFDAVQVETVEDLPAAMRFRLASLPRVARPTGT